MGYKAFILFYAVLIETFIELMIKAMDMEIIDWTEIDSWKFGKLVVMAGVLLYHSFFRWVPFLAVRNMKTESSQLFVSPLKISRIPWFLFSNVFHCMLLLIFAFLSWKLNKAAWPLYGLLLLGALEISFYVILGLRQKLFTVVMGKNNIILSTGYLTNILLKEVKMIEKKYGDEIYFTMKNGQVNSINTQIFETEKLNSFLEKLKENSDTHNIYFANDLLKNSKN